MTTPTQDAGLQSPGVVREIPTEKTDRAAGQWQPIETAPKDGAWISAWRAPPSFTGPTWEPLIYVRWDDEGEAWTWPCDAYEVFTERGKELADMKIDDGDYYSDNAAFTHWMLLPTPPAAIAQAQQVTHD